MTFVEKAKSSIEDIIKNWTKKYMYNITLLDSTDVDYIFMVEFSLPTAQKPIPIGTVQVYFYVTPTNPMTIKFKFEKDSLIHTPDQTLRGTQMENWIQSLLNKKLLIRENVFYLGTQYELTRVKDIRQDKILQVKQIPIEQEYVYISPDLLSDQKRAVEMQCRTVSKNYQLQVRQAFRAIDTEGLGVVTNQQLVQILKNIQLKLDDKQIDQIITKVDKNNHGLVSFEEYKQIADEVVKMMLAKDQAVDRLKSNQQQYNISSVMMLTNDNIHNIQTRLSEKFKKIDEDELGYLKLPLIKAVLEQLNLQMLKQQQNKIAMKNQKSKQPPKGKQSKGKQSKAKKPKIVQQQVPTSLLTLMELQQFVKKLSEKYSFNQVKYGGIVKQLFDFKLGNLRKGLNEANQTILQVYIKDLLTQKDHDHLGKIHVSELIDALKQCQKIKLTKGQLYVVKSIVERDSKDMVGYVQSSKLLAQVLKRMYLTHEKMIQDPVQQLDKVETNDENKPQSSSVQQRQHKRKPSQSSQKKQSQGSQRKKSESSKRLNSRASNRSQKSQGKQLKA